jgi:hypothetical protein
METLLTVIGLGNLLAILAIVWKGGERMGTIETNISWLKNSLEKIEDTVKDIANTQSVAKDNKNFDLMGNASPIRLKPEGVNVLENSGMKGFVDSNEKMLHENCGHDCEISAYEIQEKVFDLFDNFEFEKEVDKKFKDFAYKEGMNIETIRRIGAIYFRDKCLQVCDLVPADVDTTKPNNND